MNTTLTNKVSEKDLEYVAREVRKVESKKISKKEMDKRYAEWQMFYLNNLDIFTEDFLHSNSNVRACLTVRK